MKDRKEEEEELQTKKGSAKRKKDDDSHKKRRDEEEKVDTGKHSNKKKKESSHEKKNISRKYSSEEEEEEEEENASEPEKEPEQKPQEDPMEEEKQVALKKVEKPVAPTTTTTTMVKRTEPPSATVSVQDIIAALPTKFATARNALIAKQIVPHRGVGAPVCQHYFDNILTEDNLKKLAFEFIAPKSKNSEGGCKVGIMEKKSDGSGGVVKELMLRSCVLRVIEAKVNGVGNRGSGEDANGNTPKEPDESKRKFSLKLEASLDPALEAQAPKIAEKQRAFVKLMNGPFMERIRTLLWEHPKIRSGLKEQIRDEIEEELKEAEEKGEIEDKKAMKDPEEREKMILKKCIRQFTGKGSFANWIFPGKTGTGGKMVPGDPIPGQIFRFKKNVFFERKDIKQNGQQQNGQQSGAIVTKRAPVQLQPTQPTDQTGKNTQPLNKNDEQPQKYRHFNQPHVEQKMDQNIQDSDKYTIIDGVMYRNEYEESMTEYSDTTPKKAWEIYTTLTQYKMTHDYYKVKFVDSDGIPIDLGKDANADINTQVLKPGDYVEVDFKFWIYINTTGMGIRLDFASPITIVRQGTSSFGMASKHTYASSSTEIAAPINLSGINKQIPTVNPSSVQMPQTPSEWDEESEMQYDN